MNLFFYVLKAIVYGIFTGLGISIPLGPAGIESIRRTITNGFREGFTVALGALCADVSYLILINKGLYSLLSGNKNTECFFWIVSGFILAFIGFKSYKHPIDNKLSKSKNLNKSILSMPFVSGFLITFTNPLTPSLWLTLSGTVLRAWYYRSTLLYYIFTISIIAGMVIWFAVLNYLALKGMNFLKTSNSHMTKKIVGIIILVIGLSFIVFGLIKLIKWGDLFCQILWIE